MWAKRNNPGFTIVELLIVIVVIAILAAVTTVAYSGMQQRARNTAIVNAVAQSIKTIVAYTSTNGAYPAVNITTCVTSTSGCGNASGSVSGTNSTFETNMATIGTLPRTVPIEGPTRYGIRYTHDAARTYEGVSAPASMMYYLHGTSQPCQLANIQTQVSPSTAVTTGYTSNIGDRTFCMVLVPGPVA